VVSYENRQCLAAVKSLLRKQHQSAQKHKKHVSKVIIFFHIGMCCFTTATAAIIVVVQS